MWIFNKKELPPPPPQPIYKRQPIATIAVIITLIGMFVLGPIGALWNTMADDLKKKADNATVILLMQQQKENDDRQWQEIRENRASKNIIQEIRPSKSMDNRECLTPEEFRNYIEMNPEVRTKYKKYLQEAGRDVSRLP